MSGLDYLRIWLSSKEQTIVLSRGLGGVVGNFLGHYFACSRFLSAGQYLVPEFFQK